MLSRTAEWSKLFLAYGLWAVSGAAGFVLISLLHSAVRFVGIAVKLNPWALGALQQFVVPTLGLAWLILMLVLEHSYRTGAGSGQLLRRFGLVSAAQAVTALIAMGTIFVLR